MKLIELLVVVVGVVVIVESFKKVCREEVEEESLERSVPAMYANAPPERGICSHWLTLGPRFYLYMIGESRYSGKGEGWEEEKKVVFVS